PTRLRACPLDWGSWPLVELDVRRLGDGSPARDLRRNALDKVPSRPSVGFDGHGPQPFVHVRQPYDLHHFSFEQVEDGRWRRGWGKEPRPERHLKVWHASFGHGGYVGILCRALCRGDG